MGRGLFLVLEGIDGSGTTTQAQRLADSLREGGREVVLTREPSDQPVGKLLRAALSHGLSRPDGAAATLPPESMALLFAADRLDHVEAEIEPALRRGAVVISDRYDLSSLVYQTATARDATEQESLDFIRTLNRRARRPDLTLVLAVDPEEAARRRGQRGGEPELYEKNELQRRLALLYERAEELLGGDRVRILRPTGGIDATAGEILAEVLPLCNC